MFKSNALNFLTAFLLIVGLFIIGCASSSPKIQTSGDLELSPTALEGKKLVEERCTVCHNLNRVYAKNEDKAGWEHEVDEMIKKGANLNTEQREKVIEYLAGLNSLI